MATSEKKIEKEINLNINLKDLKNQLDKGKNLITEFNDAVNADIGMTIDEFITMRGEMKNLGIGFEELEKMTLQIQESYNASIKKIQAQKETELKKGQDREREILMDYMNDYIKLTDHGRKEADPEKLKALLKKREDALETHHIEMSIKIKQYNEAIKKIEEEAKKISLDDVKDYYNTVGKVAYNTFTKISKLANQAVEKTNSFLSENAWAKGALQIKDQYKSGLVEMEKWYDEQTNSVEAKYNKKKEEIQKQIDYLEKPNEIITDATEKKEISDKKINELQTEINQIDNAKDNWDFKPIKNKKEEQTESTDEQDTESPESPSPENPSPESPSPESPSPESPSPENPSPESPSPESPSPENPSPESPSPESPSPESPSPENTLSENTLPESKLTESSDETDNRKEEEDKKREEEEEEDKKKEEKEEEENNRREEQAQKRREYLQGLLEQEKAYNEELETSISESQKKIDEINQTGYKTAEDLAAEKAKLEEQELKEKEKILKKKEKIQKQQKKIEYLEKIAELTKGIITATANTAEGAAKALAKGPILGPVLAAMVTAQGAIQIGIITTQLSRLKATGETEKAEQGGLLQGRRHRDGGMRIEGTNIEVEGGEYVVNRRSTAKNLGLLEYINANDRPLQPTELMSAFSSPNTVQAHVRHHLEDGGQVPKLEAAAQNNNEQLLEAIRQIKIDSRVAVTDIMNAQDNYARVEKWVGF